MSRFITVILGLGVACAYLGWLGWPFEIATSVLPQMALAIAAFTLLMLAMRRRILAASSAVLLIIALAGIWPQFHRPTEPIEDPDLTIVWANLLQKRSAFDKVTALAAEEDADMIVVTEAHYIGDDMPADWPHRVLLDDMDQFTILILSKLPLIERDVLRAPHRAGAYVSVKKNGTTFIVAGLHPNTPIWPGDFKRRSRDLEAALGFLDAREKMVLVGDFNTVPWSSHINGSIDEPSFSRVPYGPRSSWLTPFPFLGLPIDHAFITPDLEAHVRVGPANGSDHLPLIVQVSAR